MIKSQLVARLAVRYPYVNRRNTERVVSTILYSISRALAEGHRIELRGFGAFSVKSRPSRLGRNPRTGQSMSVCQKNAPMFRASKELRDRVNGSIVG